MTVLSPCFGDLPSTMLNSAQLPGLFLDKYLNTLMINLWSFWQWVTTLFHQASDFAKLQQWSSSSLRKVRLFKERLNQSIKVPLKLWYSEGKASAARPSLISPQFSPEGSSPLNFRAGRIQQNNLLPTTNMADLRDISFQDQLETKVPLES